MFLSIAMSCLVAAQAMSIPELVLGIGREISGGVLGAAMRSLGDLGRLEGEKDRGVGGSYDHGMGGIGSMGSRNGHGSQGYEREGSSISHDSGHTNRDFIQITESHVSKGQDRGHSSSYGDRGHADYGYGQNCYSGMGY